MAEERLIDDDKDRKFKIRINEDGEEELVIDDTPDEDEESDVPVFAIPVYDDDDEEAAVLTPEQLAERERIKAENERIRAEKVADYLADAGKSFENNDFEKTLFTLSQIEDIAEKDGKFYCLKLKALTRNFTDFLSLEACGEAADGVKEYADEESKAELNSLAGGLKQKISEAEAKMNELSKLNSDGKEERRQTFALNEKRAKKAFIITAVPFAVLLIIAIVFSTMMFAAENGMFLILTIVFAALTIVAFICMLVAANKYWTAARNCKLNEKDTSTKLGREYLESKKEYDVLNKIYNSFSVENN